MNTDESQKTFFSVYRQRQSWLHSKAYLRTSKVMVLRKLLLRANFCLDKKSVFDFGFGAGSFLSSLPLSCSVAGVELDPVNVADVANILKKRGFRLVDLKAFVPAKSISAAFDGRTFDLVVCSHVLEHVPDTDLFIKEVGGLLAPGGLLVLLVPINESVADPKHLRHFNKDSLHSLFMLSGYKVVTYIEADAWMFPLQRAIYSSNRFLAQGVSLALGLLFCILGYSFWQSGDFLLNKFCRISFSQAGIAVRL